MALVPVNAVSIALWVPQLLIVIPVVVVHDWHLGLRWFTSLLTWLRLLLPFSASVSLVPILMRFHIFIKHMGFLS